MDKAYEEILQNVNTNSRPSDLRITDPVSYTHLAGRFPLFAYE